MKSSCCVVTAFLPLVLILAGCSEDSKPVAVKEKAPAKPAEPVSAEVAFRQMFVKARSWAPDAQPLLMGDLDLAEVKNHGGKAAAWQCAFVSESSRKVRSYTYSVIESGPSHIHEGVFGEQPETWTGRGQAQPFRVEAFQTDSVKAYQVAVKKAAEFAKEHPELPVKFLLQQDGQFPDPAWRVFWGGSVGTSSYSVFVDVATGEYLKSLR